jgi:hypothetical protein
MILQLIAKYEKKCNYPDLYQLITWEHTLQSDTPNQTSGKKITHTANHMSMHIQRWMVADMQYRPATPG